MHHRVVTPRLPIPASPLPRAIAQLSELRVASYVEAASVMLDRFHRAPPPPTSAHVTHDADAHDAGVHWHEPDDRQRRSHANDIDATAEGAYALAFATVAALGYVVARELLGDRSLTLGAQVELTELLARCRAAPRVNDQPVQVDEGTYAGLVTLAAAEGESLLSVLAKAVMARLWDDANAAYARLHASAATWEEEQAERGTWDATLADGLEDDAYPAAL